MSYEAWPSPDAPRGPLPRIEELPLAEQGYEQEAVREAFDAFYRHAAQLDASLRALEAVDAFRRDAAELRNDLRALRALGYGGVDASYAPLQLEAPRREIPAAVPRLAAECAFIIAVAVIAGLGHFQPWVIVALLGGALAIVAFVEWLAERSRFAVPRLPEPAALPVIEAEPVVVTAEEYGWAAPAEAADAPPAAGVDEMTMAGPPPEGAEPEEPADEESEAAEAPVAAEAEEVALDEEPEPEPIAEAAPEPEVEAEQPRRRWFRRGPTAPEASPEPEAPAEPEPPLEPAEEILPEEPVAAEPAGDPWEQGVDGHVDATDEPELAGRAPRFRRRRR